MGAWLNTLDKRMHWNKAIVALANKIARIAWVLLRRPQTLRSHRPTRKRYVH